MNEQTRPLFSNSGEWVFDAIKRNPEGLLLLAAGAVLLMRTRPPQSPTAPSMEGTYERARVSARGTATHSAEKVSDPARKAMDAASSYASSAMDTAQQTLGAAKSYASAATSYAGEARRKVGEKSEHMIKQTRSMAQGVLQNQPITIVLAGLAAGVALAAAFPPTDVEKDTLGPMGDQLSKAAERVGHQLKQATKKAGEALQSAADERGLDREGLKDVASEVVDTFKASIQGQPEKEQSSDRFGGTNRNR